jgi:uncharacterized protein (TIGR02646 family)
MRRLRRKPLPKKAAEKLKKEQQTAAASRRSKTLDVDKTWSRARRTKPLKSVFQVLKLMAGSRERCMYCGDSQGTDIEHFWPKAKYPARMFRWPNLLLGCTSCGRDYKGQKFPLSNKRKPLLVDPTSDDPWDHLDFDPATGNLAPRYDAKGMPQAKGEQTVDVLGLDGRRESLALGYKRSFKRIRDRILQMMTTPNLDVRLLITQLREDDEHGVLGWCFRGAGMNEAPFSDFRQAYPVEWAACSKAFRFD